MNIVLKPERSEWKELLKRPYVDNRSVLESVQMILNGVKQHGDEALRSFTKKFDGVELEQLQVSQEEIAQAAEQLPDALKAAIQQAKGNIEVFHRKQLADKEIVETMPGIECWRKGVGIEKVGLYIPGGTAPLFSTVLMLGVPAKLAGCKEIILCTPCNAEGKVHPAILYTAQLVGVTQIFKLGGAQAIAAMAYGTETVPRVYKIFGPGNQFVTAAKQLVQMEGVAIDMPAGPSEVCVLVDETANPAFVAADLLSQAEHGADSQVMLVGTSEPIVKACLEEVKVQLQMLPRKEIAMKALSHSKGIVMTTVAEAIALINEYAAEHLILSCQDAEGIADQIINAGSIFIGNYSPESVGDYASGTNHTLPTNGFAKAYSGVSVDSFLKKITYQKLSKNGLQGIAQTVIEMAEAEGLQAHANAVRVRVEP
ncbi:MAG TPA: histidinol dehydrogenase [Flavisolibacter sp.]|nr:histidinol dehydrogenase [Flavisolibacter sp.]